MNRFEQQLYGAFAAMEQLKLSTGNQAMSNSEPFDFDRAVFCYYMKTGKAATASEIAEYAGVSASTVRKVVNSNKYSSDSTTVDRPVRERNYNTIRCHRQVSAYQPRLSRMREEVIECRNRQRGFK